MTSPSESVARACPSTRARISATVDSMKLAGVQVARAPAIPITKLRRMSRPRGVWPTSGWNWIAYSPRSGSAKPASGDASVWAVGWKPWGSRVIEIAVAHPDRLLTIEAREEAVVIGDRDAGRPVFPAAGGQHVATQLAGHQLGPVADPQDRNPAAPHAAVGQRGIGVVDRVWATREDHRLWPPALDLRPGRVVREQLRIDVQLADPAGDQLGELAAEIEDDDGVGTLGAGRRRRPAGARPVVR